MVKLKDIAERCGVAISAVSDTLNGKNGSRVSAKKREEILACAAELNYRPNASARKLRGGRHYLIGVLMATTREASAEFIIEFQKHLNASGYSALFAFWESVDEVRFAYDSIFTHGVDGVIAFHPDPRLEKERVPVVFYGHDIPGRDGVFVDYHDYLARAAEYLSGLGHERVLHLGNPGRVRDYLREELRVRGMEPLSQLDIGEPLSYDNAYEAVFKYFRNIEDMPTAILANTDIIAIGAISALNDLEIKVPDDVSIIGFDNQPGSGHTIPPLTTFDLRMSEIARALTDVLIRRIDDPWASVARKLIKTRLVERKSCRTLL